MIIYVYIHIYIYTHIESFAQSLKTDNGKIMNVSAFTR